MEMLFALFGGLAMFLYGMDRMSRALQRAAGDAMKRLLARLTATPLLGVLTGLAVTAVLQSSSAATVMVIGFVSAGLLELPRAVAVIYGINIGTTMTAQLIAFDVQTLVYPVLFLGFLLDFAARRPRWQAVGEAVFSFGLLFEGIDILGRALQPLAGSCEKSRTLTSQTLRRAGGITGRTSRSQPCGSTRAGSKIMLRTPFTPAERA